MSVCAFIVVPGHFIDDDNVYMCNNGAMLTKNNLCNGIVDCVDAQDEQNCSFNSNYKHSFLLYLKCIDAIRPL